MKYQLLLLAFLSSALGTSAQQFEKVDKSKYKDYTPTYAPDPSLMRNISGKAGKADMHTQQRAPRCPLMSTMPMPNGSHLSSDKQVVRVVHHHVLAT